MDIHHAASAGEDTAGTAVYQWTDENGTINFSDNATSIKDKKGIKKRESIKGETATGSGIHGVKSDEPRAAVRSREDFGGYDENGWRSRFGEVRREIKSIQDALPEKRHQLEIAHRKKVTSDAVGEPTLEHGNPWRNRVIYKDLYYEIKADEERLANLQKKLEDLDVEASRFGVPLDWRK